MTNVLLVRRRGLGLGSCRGMKAWGADNDVNFIINTHDPVPDSVDMVVRWGATPTITQNGAPLMNHAGAIHTVNNKKDFAQTISTNIDGQLPVLTEDSQIARENLAPGKSWVVRPRHHSRGRNLGVIGGEIYDRTSRYILANSDYYMRPLITKSAEYRVYTMCNRVVAVARKTPGNPDDIAWNTAQGGRFDNVRWGDWPLDVCELALKVAAQANNIHFGGVDIMVEEGTNTPYFIEMNSAPSLPVPEDETLLWSARQRYMAQAFKYHALTGVDDLRFVAGGNWRDFIHPGVHHGARVDGVAIQDMEH
jgi:glutathione synthase/RimK-type ligase-like ATP-grasp enzyme